MCLRNVPTPLSIEYKTRVEASKDSAAYDVGRTVVSCQDLPGYGQIHVEKVELGVHERSVPLPGV